MRKKHHPAPLQNLRLEVESRTKFLSLLGFIVCDALTHSRIREKNHETTNFEVHKTVKRILRAAI